MSSETVSAGSRVFAVVLAAGEASRFGTPKQLAILDGEPLVKRAARLAREVCGRHSMLVTGFESAAVATAADGLCEFMAVNEQYRDGMGSSLALASRCLREAADAMLLILADQPRVGAAHLERLRSAWSGDPKEIVATGYAGIDGAPAVLPRGAFAALEKLDGDRGARALFDDPAFTVRSIPNADAAVDVDTPEDLERLARGNQAAE